MKSLTTEDRLIKKITNEGLTSLVVTDDKQNLSVNDEVEFVDGANKAFGTGVIHEVTSKRLSDINDEDSSIRDQLSYLEASGEADNNRPVEIIRFEFKAYDRPKKGSKATTYESLKMFSDGGSRGNPGPSASGYVLLTMDDKLIKGEGIYLGITTNNQAEYKSLKFGLEDAKRLGAKKVSVFMDSQLVIRQINGEYKIKNRDLIPIFRDIKDLAATFEEISFTHVPREFNKLADAEVNKALDAEIG